MKLFDRVRNASKLTRVRWLMVYCADLLLLIPLFGYYDLYLRWREALAPVPLIVVGVVLLLVFNVLSTRPFRIAVRGGKRPTGILAVTGVIAVLLAAAGQVFALPTWLALLAPFVRVRTVIAVSVASILLFNLYASFAEGFTLPLLIVVQSVFTTICVGAVLANIKLWRLTVEAHEGEEAMAKLAVSEERLRFARDLNDLLGRSLSDVAARTERAERTLRADPEAAAAEMFEVRDLARNSLREVRTVVQNYRAMDLDEVLSSVRAVLEAADVRCTVRAETGSLPPETRTLLATVVREGATNVLKHSKAERCTITIENGVLEMANDGVSGPVGEHAPIGLAGLAQRVRAAGGTLEAEPVAGGRYLLRAAVPA
ncbi:sensor histidine kinase [Nonomuraea gerenzanensis]|uniref:Putative two-component system sensor kinase n=1 Tax=Nonomuraea gerenzanensis TaxID=93944 RepID=A0A1M4EJY1_9ACTN|nr:histidine kinase [Nonomuraea gerenzanensis]UBU10744.1 histidine kinase [Nonomuraea gerenzanensis]SBO99172.1 Putative two-component system sensor kinase [Nonomuraea gerenzanensis]